MIRWVAGESIECEKRARLHEMVGTGGDSPAVVSEQNERNVQTCRRPGGEGSGIVGGFAGIGDWEDN